MPRSWYDYGDPSTLLSGKQVSNVELIQVLTGVQLLDGIGLTKYFDIFSSGWCGWRPNTVGAGLTPYLYDLGLIARVPSYKSGFEVILDAGNTAGAKSYINKDGNFGSHSTVGIEVGFVLEQFSGNVEVAIDYHRKGSNPKFAQVKINTSTKQMQIKVNGIDTAIDSIVLPVSLVGLHSQVKLVADFENGIYKRVLWNEQRYDLQNYQLSNGTAYSEGEASLIVAHESIGAGTKPLTVGYVRVTIDEP